MYKTAAISLLLTSSMMRTGYDLLLGRWLLLRACCHMVSISLCSQ
jgi:hypothetical protein